MTKSPDALELSKQLIRLPSVSPDDAGCMEIITPILEQLGFSCMRIDFEDVANLYAVKIGKNNDQRANLCFVGHTDIVPPGNIDEWQRHPYDPIVEDGFLWGRGAVDMKVSIACFIEALKIRQQSEPNSEPVNDTIAVLLTSDEEAASINGIAKVMPELQKHNQLPYNVLIGEPSSIATAGDRVRVGRRGSLNFSATIQGIQGHVAYPEKVVNPIMIAAKIIKALSNEQWDNGMAPFPKTSLQVSYFQAGETIYNVVPNTAKFLFNLRYSPAITHRQIIDRVADIFNQYSSDYVLEHTISAQPFFTEPCSFIKSVIDSIKQIKDIDVEQSASGGTSDGRFIAPLGINTIELGPVADTLHAINERVALSDINDLVQIYHRILCNWAK